MKAPGTVILILQKSHVPHLDRVAPPDPADNTRHGIWVSTAIQGRAGIVDINAVQRRRKAVRVALTTHFAVSNDVEARALLVPNCEERRIILSLL